MESSVRAPAREGACIAQTLSAAAIVLRRDDQPYCPHATVLAPLGCAALGVAADDDADTVGATSVDVIYCAGAAGMACWARNHLGDVRELPMTRWFGASGAAAADRLADDVVFAECSGRPTLDLGCGPGRFTAWLQRSGSAALGVDASAVAVGLTRQRGGTAMRRDLFGPLPAEGCWDHVLLADGNVGIGGDPDALLSRVAELLKPLGQALVEVEPPGAPLARDMVRLSHAGRCSSWFPWASIGADQISELGLRAGLAVTEVWTDAGRWFAALSRGIDS
jgi:SAM-dependent methyltransferase